MEVGQKFRGGKVTVLYTHSNNPSWGIAVYTISKQEYFIIHEGCVAYDFFDGVFLIFVEDTLPHHIRGKYVTKKCQCGKKIPQELEYITKMMLWR